MTMPWEMTWQPSSAQSPEAGATPVQKLPWETAWPAASQTPQKTVQDFMPDYEDMAKSAGIGLAKGAIGVAGLPGDLGTLGAYGADKAGEAVSKAFGMPYQSPMGGPPSSGFSIPGAQEIQKGIESQTGPFYQPKTETGKVIEKVGEFTPAAMAGPGGLAQKFVRQAVMPAIGSEIGRRSTGSPWGEFAGTVAGSVLNPARLITPSPANAERNALTQTLRQEGVDLTAGQRTGSKPMRWAESVSGDIPFGSGRAAATAENQREQFTAAALRRIGENEATRATPDVIDRNFTRIGNEFDRLSSSNTARFDQQLGTDLTSAMREYAQLVPESARAPIVQNTVQDLVNVGRQNGGAIPGETYQALRSRLDRAARGARADPQLSDALFGIRNSLDDAMERSLMAAGRPDEVQAWQTARNQYRNILVLEKAATTAGENAAHGFISPSALRGSVVGQNRRAYARGEGDYADLARSGAGILGDLPQSGTAPRENMQDMFKIITPLLGAEAGGGFGPGGIIGGGLAGIAAPALMSHLLMSGPVQRYFGNQLMGQGANMTPQRRLLMAQELMRTQSPQQPGQ